MANPTLHLFEHRMSGLLPIVGMLCACSIAPARPPTAGPPTLADTLPTLEQAAPTTNATPPVVSEAKTAAIDPILQLVAALGSAGCTDDPLVTRWKKRYFPAYPPFAAMLQRSAGAMAYVHQQLRARALPAEFALLPLVESQYTPFATTGTRPAGVWQLMPATARDGGLIIDRKRDQRLDLEASTGVAVNLLARLADVFDHNWQLVDYAYNAGEFSVRGALKRQAADSGPSTLRLPSITHEHWAKLCALSAILSNPSAYGASLPTLTEAEQLTSFTAPRDLALSELASATGVAVAGLSVLNAGWPRGRIKAGSSVLLPTAVQQALLAGIVELPALANATEATAAEPETVDVQKTYVVRSGDNLWTIARRFGTRVAVLVDVNELSDHQLHPGQRLKIVTKPTAK